MFFVLFYATIWHYLIFLIKYLQLNVILYVNSIFLINLFFGRLNFVFISSIQLQKNFSFLVRDSLVNIGPLRDFSYGLRINADPNATGIAKQSNYEMVS